MVYMVNANTLIWVYMTYNVIIHYFDGRCRFHLKTGLCTHSGIRFVLHVSTVHVICETFLVCFVSPLSD